MTQRAPESGTVRLRRPPRWSFVRVALIVGWVLWAGGSWWTTPREGDAARARADLVAGRVVAYDWADGWNSAGWSWSSERPSLRSPGEDGRIFAWRTTDLRVRWTTDDPSLRPALQAAGVSETGADDGPVRTTLTALVLGLGLAFLLVLVFCSAPVRGTRWFWFWLVSGIPFGLGLLVWLAREAPWSRTARPREPRRRWYVGLGVAILSSFLAVALLAAVDSVADGDIFARQVW